MIHGLRGALVRGFLTLLPFLLAYLLIGGFYDLLVLITQPLEDLIPRFGLLPAWGRQLAQIGVLALIFVAVGLISETRPARAVGGWFEREIFMRFAPYGVVRDIARRVSGEDLPNMQPALIGVGPDQHTVGFIVEVLPDDLVSVFVPFTSIPTVGSLRIVPRASVEPLDTSFLDAAGWYFNWGAGTEQILRGRGQRVPVSDERQDAS